LKDLSREVADLVRQESALARAELSDKVSQAGVGATEVGTGALITFAGFFVLLQAAMYALGPVVGSLALAGLIVGAVTLLVGLIVLARGRQQLKATELAPERTAASLRRDADLVRETKDDVQAQAAVAKEKVRRKEKIRRDGDGTEARRS
jgi:hypothetical protein